MKPCCQSEVFILRCQLFTLFRERFIVIVYLCYVNLGPPIGLPDLRDDEQFFIDHPGAAPISAAQVRDATNNYLLLVFSPGISTIKCD